MNSESVNPLQITQASLHDALALIERERAVLAQIAAGVPLNDVLGDLLLGLESRAHHRMLTSILFVSDDGGRLLHGAAPSLPAAYNDAINGIAIGEGVGSCGTAIARREPVYANDIATDPLWEDYRELALRHNLRACWSSPIRAANGIVLGTFAIYYDKPRTPTAEDIEAIAFITQTAALAIERHTSDEKIKRSQAELQRLNRTLESEVYQRTEERDRAWRLSQELLVIARADGTLEAVNASWTRLLGWDENETVGKSFVEFTHPDDLRQAKTAMAGILVSPMTDPYTYRLRCKDGSYRSFAWTGGFEAGKVYASGRDVTIEREQADALRQSQKMEAVGQLTGGLAHDFNNLLAVITGSLELLERGVLKGRPGDTARFLTAAQTAAKRAASLTHRLLAFSRRATLAPSVVNVNRLIIGIDELVRRTIGPQIELEIVGLSDLWNTRVDVSQLENAILNLCINARDAMPDGGRLTIETGNRWMDERTAKERGVAPGQYISMCVSDTGCGMPPEVIAKAFDPFFTTKPTGEGTGLGLSMIYGFARQSGGQVRIYSEVGQGSTVCIYMPRHIGAAENEQEEVVLDRPRAEAGQTVLVVDDEPAIRMLVCEVLADLGYSAIEAHDGPAALKLLRSNARIDLLVTDVGLPGGMNGRQVADAALELRPEVKILFITGYAENAAIGSGFVAPNMAVMTKPFSMDALASRIKDLISHDARH